MAALLSVACTPALAGPFGLSMGQSLESIRKKSNVEEVSRFAYKIARVPSPNENFERYYVSVTPKHGLCRIVASSYMVKTSSFGTELSKKFEQIEASLNNRYGESTKYDFLVPGSIWREPRDWMMGMLKKERKLVSFWKNIDAASRDGVVAIQLTAAALDSDTGDVTVAYDFANAEDCLAYVSSQKDSSL